MPYIYKITNTKNNKLYIGKTLRTVEDRWAEHINEAKRERHENRPLYAAMQKHGIKHFVIETIEECPESKLSDRERYWIEFYGSFKNGYNATVGGDGSPFIDYDMVVATYKQVLNQNRTAEILGICPDTVSKVLTIRNVNYATSQEVNLLERGRPINMFSMGGEYIQSFPSAQEAARYIMRGTQRKGRSGIAGHVLDVCKGVRKTAYGFSWSFATV